MKVSFAKLSEFVPKALMDVELEISTSDHVGDDGNVGYLYWVQRFKDGKLISQSLLISSQMKSEEGVIDHHWGGLTTQLTRFCDFK